MLYIKDCGDDALYKITFYATLQYIILNSQFVAKERTRSTYWLPGWPKEEYPAT